MILYILRGGGVLWLPFKLALRVFVVPSLAQFVLVISVCVLSLSP